MVPRGRLALLIRGEVVVVAIRAPRHLKMAVPVEFLAEAGAGADLPPMVPRPEMAVMAPVVKSG